MPLWLLFALSAAFFWGIGQVLAKKGFDNISPLWSNIFANIIGIFIYLPIVLIGSRFHIGIPSFPLLFLILITGIVYMTFFYAIEHGQLALSGTLLATYPIFTVIESLLFLHETIHSYQAFGIALTILGAIFIMLPTKKVVGVKGSHLWIIWGLIGASMQGTGDFFSKIAVNAVGVYTQAFWLIILFQIASVLNFIFDKKGRKLPQFSFHKFLPSLLGTGFVVCGTLSLFFAFQYGKASLVAPVTGTYPALVVFLAVIFLKEKITKRQIAGILAIILGIILVGIN